MRSRHPVPVVVLAPVLALALVLGSAGCGSAPGPEVASTPPARPRAASGPSEGSLNAPPPTSPPPEEQVAGAEPVITVAALTARDPIVRRGVGGGPRAARDIDPSCVGFIPEAPSYVLKVTDEEPDLRLLVAANRDMTLLVELADGSVVCNDDSEGLNPTLSGPFPPGRHRVFIGTYSDIQGGADYTFAITRQAREQVSTHSIESLPITP